MKNSALDQLKNLLYPHNWCHSPGNELWEIISALRGPDSGDNALKRRTTWRIRDAVSQDFFSASSFNPDPTFPAPDRPRQNEPRIDFNVRVTQDIKTKFPDVQAHFLDHYLNACWALYQLEIRGKEK